MFLKAQRINGWTQQVVASFLNCVCTCGRALKNLSYTPSSVVASSDVGAVTFNSVPRYTR